MRQIYFSHLFVTLTVVLLISTSPVDARWLRATTDSFIVYSEGSESRLRQTAAQLQQFDALLRHLGTRQNLPAAEVKLPIYLVGGPREIRVVAPDTPTSVDGFYVATPGTTAAVVFRGGSGGIGTQEILFHEYAHHFMFQYFSFAYPAWFIEGFAEYVAPTKFEGDKVDIGRFSEGRVSDLLYGRWLPFSRLMTSSLGELKKEETAAFYAQSWLLAHYLLRDPDRARSLADYLIRVENGEDAWTAFSRAFHVDDTTLKRQLESYLKGGMTYTTITLDELKASEVLIEVMPKSADDLLLLGLNAAIGNKDDSSEATLSRIRTAAARHPGDELARNVLANAEIVFGDPQAVLAVLGTLEALNGDAQGLYLYGFANLQLSQGAASDSDAGLIAARTGFARAFQINPNHYQTLYRYAQTYFTQPGDPTESIMNVLLRAHQLAPQVGEIGINTARVLMNRGRYEEAVVILRPIANDPHGGELADYARTLLKSAQRQAVWSRDWLKLEPEMRLFDPKGPPFQSAQPESSIPNSK